MTSTSTRPPKLTIYTFPKEWQDWFDRLSDREKIISRAQRSLLDAIIDPRTNEFEKERQTYSIDTSLSDDPSERSKQIDLMKDQRWRSDKFYQEPEYLKYQEANIKEKEQEKRTTIGEKTIEIFNTLLALQKDHAVSQASDAVADTLSTPSMQEFLTTFHRHRSLSDMGEYFEKLWATEIYDNKDQKIGWENTTVIAVRKHPWPYWYTNVSIIENQDSFEEHLNQFNWQRQASRNFDTSINYYTAPKSILVQPAPMLK